MHLPQHKASIGKLRHIIHTVGEGSGEEARREGSEGEKEREGGGWEEGEKVDVIFWVSHTQLV